MTRREICSNAFGDSGNYVGNLPDGYTSQDLCCNVMPTNVVKMGACGFLRLGLAAVPEKPLNATAMGGTMIKKVHMESMADETSSIRV